MPLDDILQAFYNEAPWFALGNPNRICIRGSDARLEFFRGMGALAIAGGLATDQVGCGVLDLIGRIEGDHLEIGTGGGAGSAWIVARAKTAGKVYTVDSSHEKEDLIRAIISGRGVEDKVEFVCAPSHPLPWDREFETAYIDGDHSYEGAYQDWHNVSKVTRQYVVFDDLCDKFPGVCLAYIHARAEPAWDEVFRLGRVGVLARV